MRARIEFLEEEHRRKDAILLNMTEAMKALSPPSEARESPQTVEGASESAEPRPATGGSATEGAQESTKRPQQRSGWLAPGDKLPWWHYGLGLFSVFSLGFLPATLFQILPYELIPDFAVKNLHAITYAMAWSPPGFFGFWVGYRKRNLRLWSQVLPLGALVGGVAWLGVLRGIWENFAFVRWSTYHTTWRFLWPLRGCSSYLPPFSETPGNVAAPDVFPALRQHPHLPHDTRCWATTT
jgi:hypothetical protein